MLPSVTFTVSWIHNLMFDTNRYSSKEKRRDTKYTPKRGTLLIEKSKPFLSFFEPQKDLILTLIEKKTGFNWKKRELLVYLSDTVPNSYEDPLTLKFQDDQEAMLLDLIHELIHYNIPRNLQDSVSDFEREQWVDVITKELCDELHLHYDHYRGFELRKITSFRKPKNQTLRGFLGK